MELSNLFSSGKIGDMTIRNRIVMPPMQTRGADENGFITGALIGYYTARAKGGAGLIIVQQSFAWPGAKLIRGIALWDDANIPGLKELARNIKAYGAKAAIQIGGRGTQQDNGLTAVAPSPIPSAYDEEIPRELTVEEIYAYVDAFVEAAVRIHSASFDAVEIHGAHGHLVSQFLSPYTNRRRDDFGGSVENRTRFARLILSRIREALGPEFPILFRMNGDDFIEGGITIDDAAKQANLLVAAGADALHVSGSCHETIWHHFPPYLYPSGSLVHLAAAIKHRVSVPVITVGKINDPVFANQIVRDGKADFIAMGRALIADPDLPAKAREGRLDDIRRCIYCCKCLTWESNPRLRNRGISCTVNPGVLREKEFEICKTDHPKKIMVVGAGLAGMEAARTLALRGHQVSLYEKSAHLGGQWRIAERPEGKADYKALIPYLARGLKKAGVCAILNTHVTLPVILNENPDIVLVATGAVPKAWIGDFPDGQGPNIVQANNVLMGSAATGNRLVVVGGRSIGMEAAVILAREKKHVSLVEMAAIGHGLQAGIRATLRNQLVEHGVYLFPHTTVMRITSTGVDVANNGSLLHLNADTVVLAIGVEPVMDLMEELKEQAFEVYAIGDCQSARDAMEAINEGAEIGRRL